MHFSEKIRSTGYPGGLTQRGSVVATIGQVLQQGRGQSHPLGPGRSICPHRRAGHRITALTSPRSWLTRTRNESYPHEGRFLRKPELFLLPRHLRRPKAEKERSTGPAWGGCAHTRTARHPHSGHLLELKAVAPRFVADLRRGASGPRCPAPSNGPAAALR